MRARSIPFVLILLLAASLGIAACGGDGDSAKSDDKADAKAAAAEDDAEAEEADADAEEEADAEAEEADAAVQAGIDYEDAVLPLAKQFKPLLQRYDTTGTKLVDGTIDVARATEAFTKQAAEAKRVAGQVRAIDVDDDHLMENNEQLAVAFDQYAAAMTVLATFKDTMSQAQIDATFAKATTNIDAMTTALDEWSDGLVNDPEERPFVRTAAAFEDISAFIDSL